MRKASESASPPARAGFLAKRWRAVASFLAAGLLLVACQSVTPEPAPQEELEFDMELELSLLDLPVNMLHRVRFLPPLAWQMPTGDFVSGLPLEIRFFNVNPNTGVASGTTLGSTLSTAKRTILENRGTYSTIWLSLSMLFERKATEYLRAEVRVPGGPNAPVCNQVSEHCLGYLDIYMFKGLWLGRHKVPAGFVPVPSLLGVLPINFKVLEEQAPEPEPEPEPEVITLEGLQGVTGGPLRESAQAPAPNCVSPYSARPGQGLQRVGAGLQRVGAIGGLLLVDQNQFPGTLVAPIDVGTALLGEETTTGDITRSAVVLVVDDFTNGYELPAGIFTGAPIDQYADDVSHGALVMHHLLALGEGIYPGFDWEQGVGPGGQPYWRRGVELADLQLHYLYLQAVDVGTSSTDDVPAAIMDAVYYWVDQGVEDLVVNMSFAIVPCSVANDYDAAAATPGLGIDTFEKYLEALAEVNGLSEGRLDELDTVVSIPPQVAQDPLVRFVACPIDDRGPNCDGSGGGYDRVFYNFYFVASSGNYGGSYALYPARAPTVVSVGSIENVSAAGYSVSEYSNAAEIGAPGDYFLLSSANGQTVAYTGTSFAAPAVSVFLAFDAMHQPHRCEMPTWVPQSSNPDDPPVVPPPLIATGEYDAMLPFYTLDGSPSALDSSCYADD